MKRIVTSLRQINFLILLFVLLVLSISAVSNVIFNEQLFSAVREQYGEDAEQRVRDWQQVIDENQNSDVDEKLYEINNFFNELEFLDDIDHWNQTDYWATPIEFLATNAGDCEDFTIAKYFSLTSMGVPTEKLRLMYVKAVRLNQAHMVLAYYETPESIPLVLDNINPRILPASRRRDLLPVYSFNGNGLWLARSQGRGRQVQSGGNNKLWEDLNKRIQQGK